MNERAQRIKDLVAQSQKTYQELELITGVKKSSLQRYASGVTTKIPMDVIEKLETAFNVPRGYIMGWDEPTETKKEQPTEYDGLPDNRKSFINKVMQMSDDEFDRLKQILSLVENTKL